MQGCSNPNKSGTGCSSGDNSRVCSDGEKYVQLHLTGGAKSAILACEGGCIKGEVARVAANILAYRLCRNESVRICLGDAATGNSGFFDLLQNATEVIAIEGCPLQCGTEIIRKRLPDFNPVIVNASELYEFDRNKYFEIFDMPRDQIDAHAQKVAETVQQHMFNHR
jgi:uncharacterized metal-binding protein